MEKRPRSFPRGNNEEAERKPSAHSRATIATQSSTDIAFLTKKIEEEEILSNTKGKRIKKESNRGLEETSFLWTLLDGPRLNQSHIINNIISNYNYGMVLRGNGRKASVRGMRKGQGGKGKEGKSTEIAEANEEDDGDDEPHDGPHLEVAAKEGIRARGGKEREEGRETSP